MSDSLWVTGWAARRGPVSVCADSGLFPRSLPPNPAGTFGCTGLSGDLCRVRVYPGQPDTPHEPELGITHLDADPRTERAAGPTAVSCSPSSRPWTCGFQNSAISLDLGFYATR